MNICDTGALAWLRLHEKGGKHHVVPCHHSLAEALRAFIDAAGIAEDPAQGGYVVDLDRGRLEGAPASLLTKPALWDDLAYGRRVTDYYGGLQ